MCKNVVVKFALGLQQVLEAWLNNVKNILLYDVPKVIPCKADCYCSSIQREKKLSTLPKSTPTVSLLLLILYVLQNVLQKYLITGIQSMN